MRFKELIIVLTIIMALSCNNKEKSTLLTFSLNVGGEPISIDPQLAEDLIGNYIIQNIFIGLTVPNIKTGGYEPGLAKSWDSSKDGLSYTFHLRDKLFWSDGVPITAEGIKKSYLRILNKETGSSYVSFVTDIIKNAKEFFEGKVDDNELGIKIIDNNTLQIILNKPIPYFLDMLIHATFIPVPVHLTEKYGKKWIDPKNIATSGPFKIKKRIIGEKIILERNQKYYDNSETALDEITFIMTDNQDIPYNMYLNNELDFFANLHPDIIEQAKLRKDFYSHTSVSTYYYNFNTTIYPLNNVNVRKALTLAIDRRLLTDNVLKDDSIPTRQILPNFINYKYDKEVSLFDPEIATDLFTKAGFPNGEGFPELTIKYNTGESHKKIAEFIQAQWKKNLNIETRLMNEEWTTFLHNRATLNYEIAKGTWNGEYNDPSTFFNLFLKKNPHFNNSGYLDSEYDELIEKSEYKRDPKIRQNILKKAESLIIEKNFQISPFFNLQRSYLFRNDKWTGWNPNILQRYPLKNIKPILKKTR